MTSRPAESTIRLEPTLPGRYYCDPAVLDAEWERIFYRSWLYAGREEQVPKAGDYLTFPIGRENVLVVRDAEGRLRAFYNVCRHRGARLCGDERGTLKAIRCPYHAWTYRLDGRLAAAPNLRDDAGFCQEDFSLYPVTLRTWRGCLFISLEEEPSPLEKHLGGMPERVRRYPLEDLRIAVHAVHEVEANWKILVENYQECYHCPGVHPELCDLVPLYRTGAVDDADKQEAATFRAGAVTFTHGGTTKRPLFAGLTDKDKSTYNGELLLPNSWMNFLSDFVQIRSLWPIGPTRTRLVTDWLFEPTTMAREDFDPSDAVTFTNLISEQDWKVCEAVQAGIGSRAHHHGVYAPLEAGPADFKRFILDRLGPDARQDA